MATSIPHLRPRGIGGAQQTTTVELFFDLVYVFAVTQLSHQILGDLTVAGVARAAFLLLVVWWAWIYTTWMANWFDPGSSAVRGVLAAVMLASLLMAAALPEAFGEHALLFAGELRRAPGRPQRRRGAAAQTPPPAARRLRAARRLERRVRCAVAGRRGARRATSGCCCGSPRSRSSSPRPRPATGCRVAAVPPRPTTTSKAPTSPSAARSSSSSRWANRSSSPARPRPTAGLDPTVVLCLIVAFVETAALWWLYFGTSTEHARGTLRDADDPGRLARDAYTYAHLPIVAGIIATAVASHLLIEAPHDPPGAVGVAMILGGPALYLLGESLFCRRMTGEANAKRVAVAALLILLVPLGGEISALGLSLIVASLLPALAVWELQAPRGVRYTESKTA